MKKGLVCTILAMFMLLTGCCLAHDFTEATCVQFATCTKCGEIEGELLPHTWVEATCEKSKECSVCGMTEGEPLGHNFKEATCTESAVCTTCNTVGGEAKGHDWIEADYENPKTCNVCGLTEGEPKEKPRTKEQIDAELKAVIDEIYRSRGIDPETMQGGHIDAPPPSGSTPSRNEELMSRVPVQFTSSIGVLASPVEGASLVSSYETFGAAVSTYRVEEYSNGIWVSKSIVGWSGCDSKYWILRTDYSDGLLDQDNNGIDDRDPYNNCGYMDLNHNAVADGAPSLQSMCAEEEHTPFWTCDHGVINGAYICQHQECEEFRALMRNARIQ